MSKDDWIENLFVFEIMLDEGTRKPYDQLAIDLDEKGGKDVEELKLGLVHT